MDLNVFLSEIFPVTKAIIMVIVIDNITLLRLENGGLDDVRNILKNFIEQVSSVSKPMC